MFTKIRKVLKKVNDSYEFKPLLSEIEEAPVNPLGRFTFWTVVSLVIITILWLIIGKVDVVITARGIVIPAGEAKIIQPLETGVIENILVKEGDFVKKGQLLISINTTATDAELKAIEKNLETTKYDAQRLKSQGTGSSFNSVDKTQQQLFNQSIASIQASINAKYKEISQIEQQIKSNEAQKRTIKTQYTSALDREQRLSSVKDIIAYGDLQKAQDETVTLREDLNKIEAEIGRLQAQKGQVQNEIVRLNAEFRTQKLETFEEISKRVNELEADKERIKFSNTNQKIIAPVDGYIDKLMIHTIGGVVTPAQELIALTPVDAPILIKAQVLNKDVGFIKPGMPVSIKIDTFDFQKYGILQGSVQSVSQNSIEDEQLGQVYEVYIIPKETYLIVNNKEERISTGMTLSAEIKIDKRRIIEFFIYPLIKYLDEGISVR